MDAFDCWDSLDYGDDEDSEAGDDVESDDDEQKYEEDEASGIQSNSSEADCQPELASEEEDEDEEEVGDPDNPTAFQKHYDGIRLDDFRQHAAYINTRDQALYYTDAHRPIVTREGEPFFIGDTRVNKGLSGLFAGVRQSTLTRRVRFAEDQTHRPEAEYRDCQKCLRRSPMYKKGLYADTTGLGFWNTSKPEDEEVS